MTVRNYTKKALKFCFKAFLYILATAYFLAGAGAGIVNGACCPAGADGEATGAFNDF
jgi:hypothetical protein